MSVHSDLLFNHDASDLPVFLLSEIIRQMRRNKRSVHRIQALWMPRPDRISTLRYIIVKAACVRPTALPHPALAAAAAAHFVYL